MWSWQYTNRITKHEYTCANCGSMQQVFLMGAKKPCREVLRGPITDRNKAVAFGVVDE